MKTLVFIIVITIIMLSTGCSEREVFFNLFGYIDDSFNCSGIFISASKGYYEAFGENPTYGWVINHAEHDSLIIKTESYLSFARRYKEDSSKVYYLIVKRGKEKWNVPINPETSQVLDLNAFITKNSDVGVTKLRNRIRFYLDNKSNIQYILDTINKCPEIKQTNMAIPWKPGLH